MIVIEGTLSVERDGARARTVGPGEVSAIAPGVVHATVNRGDATCRFLLVQTGRFDFLPIDA